jgi:hypothetical protein
MMRRRTLLFTFALALAALLAAGCGGTTVTERVPQTVIVTAEVPEVTRLVTREVTREATVIVTRITERVERYPLVVTATPLTPPDRLGEAAAFQAAVRYLTEQQRNGGGYGGAANTAWAILALHAAGLDPETITARNGRSPLDYIDNIAADSLVSGAEARALTYLALVVAGRDAPALGLSTPPFPSSWPGLPMTAVALGRGTPAELSGALVDALDQAKDEGFEDVAQAAWGIMALKASGVRAAYADPIIETALDYLREQQLNDGTWPSAGSDEPDAYTTALAIQALAAAREDMLDWDTPAGALLDLQHEDGSFDGSTITTSAAIIALRETWLGGLAAR